MSDVTADEFLAEVDSLQETLYRELYKKTIDTDKVDSALLVEIHDEDDMADLATHIQVVNGGLSLFYDAETGKFVQSENGNYIASMEFFSEHEITKLNASMLIPAEMVEVDSFSVEKSALQGYQVVFRGEAELSDEFIQEAKSRAQKSLQ